MYRFDPRNEVMKFGDQEWRRRGESGESHIEGEKKEVKVRRGIDDKENNKEEEGNIKNEDKDKVEDEVQTVRPKRKEGFTNLRNHKSFS